MVCNWFYPLSFLWTFHIWLLYIAFFDMMRLFIKSLMKKERNVWIIGIGVLLSQSAWILYQNYLNTWVAQHQEFLAYCIALAVPITLLIFNALRTARTTINLENQLVEVKRLSDLSIAQEQEKQQILTAQKELLELQVKDRTTALSQSLENLKAMQDQLIQSEKMASMGELTAGIAHEIQNPLNFVNNFSELNSELSEEIIKAIKSGNIKEAETLAEDIRSNQMKVREHGQQADAIVKSMLQHSHSGTGHKEPTDINALANEYLRLAFNGFRAKNKSFSATLILDLDTSLEKFQVIPEQIGRVLLNLYNNAFYTVSEKKKTAGEEYIPTVTVSTGRINNMTKISVKDNGMGMSEKVSHKIFQPFFTTKPAGKGAGLGLSLSYDIIKAHHGEIKADSQEGEFTEITILLPDL
jgi:signal transduction histidine kinase